MRVLLLASLMALGLVAAEAPGLSVAPTASAACLSLLEELGCVTPCLPSVPELGIEIDCVQ